MIRLVIQIKEPRENIDQRFNSENIDYSIDRFKHILKIELKRRYNE